MIREMTARDKDCVLEMMRVFYASPAVLTGGSEEIFITDIETCVSDSPYLEGYIMEEAGVVQGYAMVAKSFPPIFILYIPFCLRCSPWASVLSVAICR